MKYSSTHEKYLDEAVKTVTASKDFIRHKTINPMVHEHLVILTFEIRFFKSSLATGVTKLRVNLPYVRIQ